MSFSAVDNSPSPRSLVDYLDGTTRGQWGMKNYIAATFGRDAGDGAVLDVGCGTGSDLVLLRQHGVAAVGVDVSAVMADTARERGAESVCVGAGEALPFRRAAFSGCRIERVLMHTVEPLALVQEAARCVRSNGLLAMLEPDWPSFTVADDAGMTDCGWLNSARHPGAGSELWGLAEASGFEVLDQVEELSVWRSLKRLDAIVGGAAVAVSKAIAVGRVDADEGRQWLERQVLREEAGKFVARMRKVLVVARRRP